MGPSILHTLSLRSFVSPFQKADEPEERYNEDNLAAVLVPRLLLSGRPCGTVSGHVPGPPLGGLFWKTATLHKLR
jgi:hypothetical protein